MSGAQSMLEYLKSGKTVGTSNKWCEKFGVNQVPDLARKLKNKGIKIRKETITISKNGKTTRVAQYYLGK